MKIIYKIFFIICCILQAVLYLWAIVAVLSGQGSLASYGLLIGLGIELLLIPSHLRAKKSKARDQKAEDRGQGDG